ncbi:unnamed protein product [Rhizophagus irregularis]|uniref:MATA-HMG n=1 Tax=Rhizophagus irregularis TaxID=588596 RepID=A0A2N1N6I4_9GLOM|nr:hypothetical protein RhiirC2_712619 [Rhizophagus irregularis]CAB5386832.1 unnamed protein product [Rhizophagus irregularis]
MSQLEKLYNTIKKNLEKIDTELIEKKTVLPLITLLEPTVGRRSPNAFIIYCKDHASFIKNKPGDNSKLLGKMWDNEPADIRMVYGLLSNIMSTSYKEFFSGKQPLDQSISMPAFCVNPIYQPYAIEKEPINVVEPINMEEPINSVQDSDLPDETKQQKQEESTPVLNESPGIIQQDEVGTERDFINPYLALYLAYYNI